MKYYCITISGVFLSLFLATSGAHASTESDAVIYEMTQAIKAHDYPTAMAKFRRLDGMGVKLPLSAVFFRGQAEYHSGVYWNAVVHLKQYADRAGRKGRYYREAIALLIQARKQNKSIKWKREEKEEETIAKASPVRRSTILQALEGIRIGDEHSVKTPRLYSLTLRTGHHSYGTLGPSIFATEYRGHKKDYLHQYVEGRDKYVYEIGTVWKGIRVGDRYWVLAEAPKFSNGTAYRLYMIYRGEAHKVKTLYGRSNLRAMADGSVLVVSVDDDEKSKEWYAWRVDADGENSKRLFTASVPGSGYTFKLIDAVGDRILLDTGGKQGLALYDLKGNRIPVVTPKDYYRGYLFDQRTFIGPDGLLVDIATGSTRPLKLPPGEKLNTDPFSTQMDYAIRKGGVLYLRTQAGYRSILSYDSKKHETVGDGLVDSYGLYAVGEGGQLNRIYRGLVDLEDFELLPDGRMVGYSYDRRPGFDATIKTFEFSKAARRDLRFETFLHSWKFAHYGSLYRPESENSVAEAKHVCGSGEKLVQKFSGYKSCAMAYGEEICATWHTLVCRKDGKVDTASVAAPGQQ